MEGRNSAAAPTPVPDIATPGLDGGADPARGPDPAQTPIGQAMTADTSGLRLMIYMASVFEITRQEELDRALKRVGLSVAKDRVLSWLSINPGASMTQLSRGVTIDRTTLTRLMDQMVKDGDIERERSPVDRRGIALRLTDRGRGRLREGIEITDAVNARYSDVLTPDEVRTVSAAMLKLLNASSMDDATFTLLTRRQRRPRG